jgi:hypothetical protein
MQLTLVHTVEEGREKIRDGSQRKVLVSRDDYVAYMEQVQRPHGEKCGLCRKEYGGEDCILETIQCKHAYHKQCITGWFYGANPQCDTCPECRQLLYWAEPRTAEQKEQASADSSSLPVDPPREGKERPGLSEDLQRFAITVADDWIQGVLSQYAETELSMQMLEKHLGKDVPSDLVVKADEVPSLECSGMDEAYLLVQAICMRLLHHVQQIGPDAPGSNPVMFSLVIQRIAENWEVAGWLPRVTPKVEEPIQGLKAIEERLSN